MNYNIVNIMARPQEEDILEKDFKILTSLGCGSFEEVMLAHHLPTNTKVAIKALHKAHNKVAYIRSEIAIHKSLQHCNIIQFFHAINMWWTTYVIMEYSEGKDLAIFISKMGCLKEEEAQPIFNQLASAVHFLHQRRIAHRDIKLENILLGEGGKVKLCDFGLATQLVEGQMLHELWGSLPYWAPEILARKPYDGALKHPKLDNITATINIIRFKLTSGDSSLQNNIPAVATSLPDPMKRRHSKPALLMKYRSNVRLHTYSCPEVMHYSDNRVPGESLPASTINPATGDTAVNLNSADGLSDKKDPEDSLPANTINPTLGNTAVNTNSADGLSANFSSPEPPLKGKCIGVVNIAFTEEEPSTEPDMPSDQPQDVPKASGTRPLRGWKLIKKRISRALRALCCCCLPTPETEVA
ncbi:Sperm motility kinase [Microtus ochrogaster]|uniref:non-specific serine/threonine protein kinase n=1 Tax=Microtus ochrogaster TaxID=79684 RepID=A0A8J6GX08_MICOH|nr:Sperm motility kinase [Microtus ochrogaster]